MAAQNASPLICLLCSLNRFRDPESFQQNMTVGKDHESTLACSKKLCKPMLLQQLVWFELGRHSTKAKVDRMLEPVRNRPKIKKSNTQTFVQYWWIGLIFCKVQGSPCLSKQRGAKCQAHGGPQKCETGRRFWGDALRRRPYSKSSERRGLLANHLMPLTSQPPSFLPPLIFRFGRKILDRQQDSCHGIPQVAWHLLAFHMCDDPFGLYSCLFCHRVLLHRLHDHGDRLRKIQAQRLCGEGYLARKCRFFLQKKHVWKLFFTLQKCFVRNMINRLPWLHANPQEILPAETQHPKTLES